MQVALMFLAVNSIPTEPIWTAFMLSAAEVTLKQNVPAPAPRRPRTLPPPREQDLQARCMADGQDHGTWAHGQRIKFHGALCDPHASECLYQTQI
jgi:hypothetical protein